MLSDKFLDDMWRKCSWVRFEGWNQKDRPESVTLNSNQLRDLLDEIKALTAQVKSPMVTSLWGKPMGYWIELEKSISSWEYPSGLAWHNWQLKEENEKLKKQLDVFKSSYETACQLYTRECEEGRQLEKSLTEAINANTGMRRTIELIRAALG